MTRNDGGTTDGIDSDPPNRTDVLDGASGRGGLAGATGRRRAEAAGPTASRRSLLGAVGTVGAAALTGCLGAVTGQEAAFHAPPALLRLPPLSERRDDDVSIEMAPVQLVQGTGTVDRLGLSRDVVATAWGATYGLAVDLGDVDGLGHFLARDGGRVLAGEEILVSVPKVEVAGRRLVDPGDLSFEEIADRIGSTEGSALGQPTAGERGPASEDGLLRGTALDFGVPTSEYLRGAYGGSVEGLSDVTVSPRGAQTLADSAERPLLFDATARRLVDGGETRLVGAVQRFELDDAYVFRASTRTVSGTAGDVLAASVLGAAGENSNELTSIDVGSGGDDAPRGDLGMSGDIDDYPDLKTCLDRRRDCIARCYDLYDRHSAAWGDCLNDCPHCGHLLRVAVLVGANEAPRVRPAEDLVAVCPGATPDSSACVGDVVRNYAELQVSDRQWTG